MAKTIILHPEGFIRNIGEKVGLSIAVVEQCVETHLFFGDDACSLHDIYLSIFDGIAGCEETLGYSSDLIIEMEEKATRISGMSDWGIYDHRRTRGGCQ